MIWMIEVPGCHVMVVEWTLIALTLGLLSLRIYVLRKIKPTLVTFNDAFAVLSWVGFVVGGCFDAFLFTKGYFDCSMIPTVTTLKIQLVEGAAYFWGLYAAKACMLCFYTELVPCVMRKTRLLLKFTIVLTFVGFFTAQGMAFVICQLIRSDRSFDENVQWSSQFTVPSLVVSYIFHLLTDVLIYTIPILVVRKLHLPPEQMIAVFATFALGFICVLLAVTVIITTYTVDSIGFPWIWGCFEEAWAVVIVCAPSFKYFISNWTPASGSPADDESEVDDSPSYRSKAAGPDQNGGSNDSADRGVRIGWKQNSKVKAKVNTRKTCSEEELNPQAEEAGISGNNTSEIELQAVDLRAEDLERQSKDIVL